MSRIKSRRQISGIHRIDLDGKPVGEAWRWTSGAPGFGLRLNGYYWRDGSANQRSGSPTTPVKRLRDAVALAAKTLGVEPAAGSQA